MSWHRMLAILVYTFISLTFTACSDSAKEASGKDREKPISTTKPAAGKFNKTQTVQLSCDDQRGSGCVATYYTLNGEEPDTSSKKFTDPFTINKTTTIKYFSVDAEGNQEAVKTAVFTFDQVAPKVVSSDPPNGGANVPLNGAEIRITFDEDIDPTTITTESISVNNRLGPIMGTIGYDTETKTAVLKMEEVLKPNLEYVVKINPKVKDRAGNSIEPIEWRFDAASTAWVAADGALMKLSSAKEELLILEQIDCQPLGKLVHLAIDKNSQSIWVADAANNRVIKLDENGELLAMTTITWPLNLVINPVDGTVLVQSDGKLIKLTALGKRHFETNAGIDNLIYQSKIDNSIWVTVTSENLQPEFKQLRFTGSNTALSEIDYSEAITQRNGVDHKSYNLPLEQYVFYEENEKVGYFWGTEEQSSNLLQKYSIEGELITKAETVPELSSIYSPSIVQKDETVWSISDYRLLKYSKEGKLLLNKSIDSTSGFSLVVADPIDGGAWVGDGNPTKYISAYPTVKNGLLRFDENGNESWRSSGITVQAIAIEWNKNLDIFVSQEGSDESGNGSKGKPYATINKAVAAAQEGDSIKVGPGRFTEDIKSQVSLKLIGSGKDNTTIVGSGNGSAIDFDRVKYAQVKGFTITNAGKNTDKGSAVGCSLCRELSVEENLLSGNIVGVAFEGDDGHFVNGEPVFIPYLDVPSYQALIQHNTIENNDGGISGYGIITSIRNNLVVDNTWGIYIWSEPESDIINNVVSRNKESGISLGCSGSVLSNIISENGNDVNIPALSTGGISITYPNPTGYGGSDNFRYWEIHRKLSYNNLYDNTPGNYIETYEYVDQPDVFDPILAGYDIQGGTNLESNPLFIDVVNGNFIVQEGSPTLNAGPANENPDATAECGSPNRRNDIGAYGGLWGDW